VVPRYRAPLPYPPRPQLRPLPEFSGTAKPRPDPTVQAWVEAFIVDQYAAGRSLRQLAELTDRSFSAVGTSSPGAASTAAELARWRCRSLATEASRGGHERGWPVASEPPACRYET
jgi:hypothetical protein